MKNVTLKLTDRQHKVLVALLAYALEDIGGYDDTKDAVADILNIKTQLEDSTANTKRRPSSRSKRTSKVQRKST